MALDFKEYHSIAQNNREMIVNDEWEVEITVPSGIYAPPVQIINQRVQNVDLGIDMNIESLDAQLRGFNLTQAGHAQTAGALSFTLMDFEDMSLQYMFEEWATLMSNRGTRRSHRGEDYKTIVKFRQYNTTRQLIKSWIFYGCHPINNPQTEMSGFDASNRQNVGMLNWTLKYEHYERTIHSAPEGRLKQIADSKSTQPSKP